MILKESGGDQEHKREIEHDDATEDDRNSVPELEPDIESTPRRQLRRSTRHSKPPERLTYVHSEEDEEEFRGMAIAMITISPAKPATLQEALNSPESESWKQRCTPKCSLCWPTEHGTCCHCQKRERL